MEATATNPYSPYTTIGQLAAIWMQDNPIITGDLKRTVRIEKGQTVRLEAGKMVNCSTDAPANFEVIDCFGNNNSSMLMFMLRNLTTQTTILYPVKTV